MNMKNLAIIFGLFTQQVLSEIITVAPAGSTETADYYCDGTNDEEQIQTAICALKGYPNIYSGGSTTADYFLCGRYNAQPDEISDAIKLNGGTVRLLEGTFIISQNIRIYSNIILEGAGIDLTIIKVMDNAPEFPNSGILRMPKTDNNIIQDFTIDGNKDSEVFDASSPTSKYRYGVYTQESTRIHMRRVRAYNCPGYGFDPHGVPGEAKSTDYMIIEGCYAEDNNLDGFTIDKSFYVTVTNNWAINNHRNGYEITTGAKGVHITNNHAVNNGVVYATGACGIKIQDQYNNGAYWGGEYATVSNNFIEGSGTDGICVVEQHRVLIDSNIIRTSGKHCIRLRDTSYDGTSGSPNGNSEKGSDDSIVSNNMCIDNTHGIAVEDSHRVIVQGNRIGLSTENSDHGIVFKRSTDSMVTGNNVCGTQGVDIQGSNSNILDSNNLVCETTSAPTDSPTPSPTIPGQTPSPTANPTPAPTSDLSLITPLTVISQSLTYDYDDDRIIDTWKEANGDFIKTDISSWANGNRLVAGAAIHMRILLSDVGLGFYPVRFEYTSMSTNNNNGIIFNWPIPSGGWVNGWNTVVRVIEEDDYYGTIDWTDMDRLQLYHANTNVWSGDRSIEIEVKVCDPNSSC